MEIIAVMPGGGKKEKLIGQSRSVIGLPKRIRDVMGIKDDCNMFHTITGIARLEMRKFLHVAYVEKGKTEITIYRRINGKITEVGIVDGDEKDFKKVKCAVIETVILSATEMGLTVKGQEKFCSKLRAMID